MRYLSLAEVLDIHRQIIERSGGSHGLRDSAALESALAQPRQTFDGSELHPTLAEKVAALGFSIIQNHAFVDGNKRIGHAVMEVMLLLNGFEIRASVDESESLIMDVAAGKSGRAAILDWLRPRMVPVP